MSSRDIYPLVWHMDDPDVLAYRFDLPQELKEYTAVTVFPDQKGLAFLNSQHFFLGEPDNTYMLTGDRIDSVVQGYHIMQAGSTPVTAVNPRLTLFDMRVKERQSDFIELKNSENRTLLIVRIVISYRLSDTEAGLNQFLSHAAAFRPGSSGSQIHLSDVAALPTFETAVNAVHSFLSARLSGLTDPREAKAAIQQARDSRELMTCITRELTVCGLVPDALHILPVDALCPHCQHPLSLEDIKARRCSHCAEDLYSCPHCQALIGPHHDRCPVCRRDEELLFCESCRSYCIPVRGRFCPACHRACYPPRRPIH